MTCLVRHHLKGRRNTSTGSWPQAMQCHTSLRLWLNYELRLLDFLEKRDMHRILRYSTHPLPSSTSPPPPSPHSHSLSALVHSPSYHNCPFALTSSAVALALPSASYAFPFASCFISLALPVASLAACSALAFACSVFRPATSRALAAACSVWDGGLDGRWKMGGVEWAKSVVLIGGVLGGM